MANEGKKIPTDELLRQLDAAMAVSEETRQNVASLLKKHEDLRAKVLRTKKDVDAHLKDLSDRKTPPSGTKGGT